MKNSLERVKLIYNGTGDKMIHKYSEVEKRRLSIAISLLGDPRVCLDYLCSIYATVKNLIYLFISASHIIVEITHDS